MPKVAKKKKAVPVKEAGKKVAKTKVPAKASTNGEATNGRTTSKDLEKLILKFMRKGKQYSSREVVEGLGRKPGQLGGGPVVNVLKRLAEEKVVTSAPNEGKAGYAWVK
jgi:hypothetical protein